MSTTAEMAAETEAVVKKVQKLLALAAKNPNENEAAAAAAKAQDLLAAYNLDIATVEQAGGDSGKREDARVRGGMYVYEREMWEAIAQLNFCFYFTLRLRHKTERKDRSGYERTVYGWRFEHKLIGRVVNTTATKVLGQYLQGTIERLCRERFPANNQFFMREAVSYREGMADRVREKLVERRLHLLDEETRRAEKAEADYRRAAHAGASSSTVMTLVDVAQSEEAANYDFMHGEGAWARKKKAEAEWEAGWEKRRAARAAAQKAADEAHAAWAAANPEEAAREAKKEAARQRAADRRAANRSYSYRGRAPTERERRQSSPHYLQGYDKGGSISLDGQVGSSDQTRRLR